MTLSVIIVNFNVKFFLEQCLCSLEKALININAEVIVVDNNSSDGSVEYLQQKFPSVLILQNDVNMGFAKACNLGLSVAKGEYILFLNPDTLLSENAIQVSLEFFDHNPDTGAIGLKMIDGSGSFLKESKRSFPSPLTSLFKLFGLSRLFPRSKMFSRYHLGHLDKNQAHKVEVLAGAYFFTRKTILDKLGSFDERFFMYGEDVDLSYRIYKAGFNNYYLPEASIIHFKGESTKRGSLNYVRMFYKAMSQFVEKHYGGAKATFFRFAIQTAIIIRAIIAAIGNFINWVGLPVVDAAIILLSFSIVKEAWVTYVRTDVDYPEPLLWYAFPAFTLVYLVVAYYAGLYNKYFKAKNLLRSTIVATVVLLALYALLPEKYRFSRGILVFGAGLSFLLIALLRAALIKTGFIKNLSGAKSHPYIVVVGSQQEYSEVQAIMQQRNLDVNLIGRVSLNTNENDAIANIRDLSTVKLALNIKEIVFCAGTLKYAEIIDLISSISNGIRFRFHAKGTEGIVGSDSSTAVGEVISPASNMNIAYPGNRRLKRLIDILVSLAFIISLPLHLLLQKKAGRFFKNCCLVLAGSKTWVGYNSNKKNLPPLRESIITAIGNTPHKSDSDNLMAIDYWYAMNYEPLMDLKLILKNYRQLDN